MHDIDLIQLKMVGKLKSMTCNSILKGIVQQCCHLISRDFSIIFTPNANIIFYLGL